MRIALFLEAVLFLVPSAALDSHRDPYGYANYAEFHAYIARGGIGILVVGIPDRHIGTYQVHCRVPSGFGGLTDGEYRCFTSGGAGRPGVPLMERIEPVCLPGGV